MARGRVILGVAGIAAVMMLSIASREQAWAGLACEVPAAFALAVEQRQMLDAGSPGLVVVRSAAPSSSLRAGDVIRQANGRPAVRCADLEATAAEALAKGLVLLLAAERDGRLVAVALSASTASATANEPFSVAVTGNSTAATTAIGEPVSAAPTVPRPTSTPVVPREAALPPRADASAELTAKALAAAAVLGTVEEAAGLEVPLAAYERRLDDAKNAIAALSIEGEGRGAVRSVVDEAFGYYETARDIRRYKAAELSHARIDQRGASAISLPYFSDSNVPGWVERYPFLRESLQRAPRSWPMLLSWEMPGRWNPDQAVELLWERAGKAAARLGAWAAGK